MATIKSTDENFDTLVKENKILICDFWASWCGPCLQIAPLLEQLSDEMKELVRGMQVADAQLRMHEDTLKVLAVGRQTMAMQLNEKLKSVNPIS